MMNITLLSLLISFHILVVASYSISKEKEFSLNELNVTDYSTPEDINQEIKQLLEQYGYPLEIHEVTTEDGYILTLHRIPHGRNDTRSDNKSKPAVLLLHGILCSSANFINEGPTNSIAMNLADEGYDVWLGNNRGNTFSRKHVSLDPDANKTLFWDFSWDNFGYYDVPAKIDHILNITGLEKISFIGHSQGTTVYFAMAALRPEYNDKINIMVALGPVAYISHLSQPLVKLMADNMDLLVVLANIFDLHELLPYSDLFPELINSFCTEDSKYQEVCAAFVFFLVGFDSAQLNRTLLPEYASYTPAGISFKQIVHYGQEINSDTFRRYDYGAIKNLEVYKQISPPDYNISLITSPIALYYAENDLFSAVPDVERFAEQLPNLVVQHLMENKLFNHLDFLWAIDVKTLLNNDIIELLKKYNDHESLH